jgi:hypothetical protein
MEEVNAHLPDRLNASPLALDTDSPHKWDCWCTVCSTKPRIEPVQQSSSSSSSAASTDSKVLELLERSALIHARVTAFPESDTKTKLLNLNMTLIDAMKATVIARTTLSTPILTPSPSSVAVAKHKSYGTFPACPVHKTNCVSSSGRRILCTDDGGVDTDQLDNLAAVAASVPTILNHRKRTTTSATSVEKKQKPVEQKEKPVLDQQLLFGHVYRVMLAAPWRCIAQQVVSYVLADTKVMKMPGFDCHNDDTLYSVKDMVAIAMHSMKTDVSGGFKSCKCLTLKKDEPICASCGCHVEAYVLSRE